MGRILVVTHDPAVMQLAAISLTDAGFEVVQSGDPEDAVHSAREFTPDAIVIDLQLPDGHGHSLCRWAHSTTEWPILALSAFDDVNDVEDGRDDGADDYLVKPFTRKALIARLRVLMRHAGRRGSQDHLVLIRDLTIDQQRLQVIKSGRPINLTPTQFRLLSCLARNAGRVLTSQELLHEAQGYDCEEQEAQEIVKVHINHLRQKIEPDVSNPVYIVNVRGFGYMLERRSRTG